MLISCQDDPIVIDADLHLDGINFSAPTFNAGTYTCAARFSAGVTTEFFGQEISEIDFYLADIPNQVTVQVFGEGTATEPGTLLYQSDVTSTVIDNSWNRHVLTDGVFISGEDLWIAVEISQTSSIPTIGCDRGPAVPSGDWVNIDGITWRTFRDLSVTESINWNIRANVSE